MFIIDKFKIDTAINNAASNAITQNHWSFGPELGSYEGNASIDVTRNHPHGLKWNSLSWTASAGSLCDRHCLSSRQLMVA